MKRIIEFLAAYFRRPPRDELTIQASTPDGTAVPVAVPGGVDALNAMLDAHYADARAVVDAGRDDPPTTVLAIDPAPIAPAPPAELPDRS